MGYQQQIWNMVNVFWFCPWKSFPGYHRFTGKRNCHISESFMTQFLTYVNIMIMSSQLRLLTTSVWLWLANQCINYRLQLSPPKNQSSWRRPNKGVGRSNITLLTNFWIARPCSSVQTRWWIGIWDIVYVNTYSNEKLELGSICGHWKLMRASVSDV